MEKLETLTGKYGDEGDRLIFKILNSGRFLEDSGINVSRSDMESALKNLETQKGENFPVSGLIKETEIIREICEKALRYDLTVPFARYVAMNKEKISFPFRRYQIQPVWRADRPQKGRYREFWQCDADIVGSNALLNEAELIQIYDKVFDRLKLPINILVNNRKILSGIAEVIGYPQKFVAITTAIDKLDKIGIDKVADELLEAGLSLEAIQQLKPVLQFQGNNKEKLDFLEKMFERSASGLKGIEEMRSVLNYFEGKNSLGLKSAILTVDICLARGLNYYTGSIFEVKASHFEFGSLGGGGRYDDLTGIFGLNGFSGVGISFGADRIYDVLLENNLFPDASLERTIILIANFGNNDELAALPLLDILRQQGIPVELYPDAVKIRKQFEYAEKKGISYLLIFGEEERNASVPQVLIKNIQTGEQKAVAIEQIKSFVQANH